MLKIGDFSKLSRVSIRMLRHYDDIGLLKPAEIDTFSGYRYYREEQLYTAARITALKDMGFALADIARMLEVYDDSEKLDERHRDHALFVAFAPADNPKIAVAVMVENGESGSGVAAPVARQVMDAWLLDEQGRLKPEFAAPQAEKVVNRGN